jgi:hypothetical protein
MSQNYELTDYPKKYSDTYWGNGANVREAEIFANRNAFITKNNVDKYYSILSCNKERSLNKIFDLKDKDGQPVKNFRRDHIEYYKTKKNHNSVKTTICIFSQTNSQVSYEIFNLIEINGYSEIQPMYDTTQRTFMKVV